MAKETSVYLDAVRFLAAIIVLLDHFGAQNWTGGLGWQFVRFGPPAVVVFFVLSGFVIAFVTGHKERDWRSYAISRAARIYSVCIPALVITVILAVLGTALHLTLALGDNRPTSFLRSIVFVHQLWFSNIEPGNDGPYWSLGYEVPYYALYGLALFAPIRFRWPLLALAVLVVGPRIMLMMPIWLTGIAAFRICDRVYISKKTGFAIWLSSTLAIGILAGMALWGPQITDEYITPFVRPFPDVGATLVDYFLGLLVAANFVGFNSSAPIWSGLAVRAKAWVSWLAGATFTIYIAHYPVALFLIAISPWPVGSWAERGYVYVVTIVLLFLIAEIGERRKTLWRRLFQNGFGLIFGPGPRVTLPSTTAIDKGNPSR